jgi:aminomethyltransferase
VPVREGSVLFDGQGHKVGVVTSGTLAPTVNQPIALAYLPSNRADASGEVWAEVRGKRWPMRVTPMPFAPHRYHRS